MRRNPNTSRLAATARAELQLEGLEARDVPASFVSFTGATYSQNFNNLGTSTVTNLISPGVQYLDEAPVSVTSLNGWSINRLGGTTGSGPYPLTVGTGSSNTGGVYNFATAAAPTDRALGTLRSGAFAANLGVVLKNNSGSPITQLDISYFSEQYRRGGSGNIDRLDFQFQFDVSDISPTTGWTNISVLNATSADTQTSASAIDGNGAGRLTKSITLDFSPGAWAVGQTLVFRWVDQDIPGSDDGLAIDDFVMSIPGGSSQPAITTQPGNQTITAGGSTTFTAAATGSPAPTVQWEVKVPGGSFVPATGGVYSGGTTDTLTVTGATVGMSGNLYRAVYTNTQGTATTNEVSLTVNSAAITVTPASLPDPVFQTAYSQSVFATGGGGSYMFTVSTGTPPTGLTLSAAGVLAGTPTASGTFTFTVLATDAFGSTGTRAYTLVVPLVVGPAGLPDGTRGVAYNQTVTATGGTAPYSFAVTAGALPGGLTLDASTGVVSGTPDTPNTFNFTVTVTNGVGRSGSRAYTVVVAPSAGVASIVRVGGPDTNATSVSWTITFSHPVSNLTATNLTLLDVDTTLTGEGITGVISTGAEPATVWTVTASTGSGDGRLRLNVTDPAGTSPTLIGLPTTVTTADFVVDKTAPTVVIGPPSASLTAGGPVTFTVTYTGADSITLAPGNVVLNTTGSVTATVGVGGSGSTRTVTLTGITGTGTLGISLPANTASDNAGNPAAAAGPSTTLQVDNTPPTVSSVVRVGAAAVTNAAQVQYTVTFSDPVTLGATPFVVTSTGTLSGVSVTNVGGGPTAYTVTVATVGGDGTIRLDVPAGAGVTDLAGNPLAAAFTAGEPFTIDRTAPTVVISPPSATLTRGGPVSFTVTYADANGVTPSLQPSDITLNPGGGVTANIAVTGSGNTRTVTLDSIAGNGTLGISIASGTAIDGANNAAPSAGPSATFTVDNTPPTVTGVVRAAGNPNPTNTTPVTFTVTFNEDVGTPPLGAFTLTTSGSLTGAAVTTVTSVDARTYTVAVALGAGDGTLRLNVPAGAAITDTAGNPVAVAFTTGEAYTVLTTAPAVATTNPTTGSVIGPVGYSGTISGTAADALGGSVASVSVTIQRASDGSYWNGAAWAGGASLAATVSGTTWSVPFPAAAQATGLTYTVTSTATDAAGNVGTAAAVAYQWDATPAAATVALPGAVVGPSSWSGTVVGTATDTGPAGVAVVNVVVTRSSDGFSYNAAAQTWAAGGFTNAVVPAAGAWALPLPTAQFAHGVGYTVSAAAIDAVGNAQASPAAAGVTFDAVAPTSAVTTPAAAFVGPTGWPASDQLAGTVNDAGVGGVAAVSLGITRSSDGFYWNGATWQSTGVTVTAAVAGGSWTYTLAATALTDGLTYTVASTATDGAGNVQAAPGSRSFIWDAAAPSQTITSPVGGSFAGPATFGAFAGTAADPGATASGVAAVELTLTRGSDGFYWNGTAFVGGSTTFPAVLTGGSWTTSFDPADLADGVTYTLSAAARDVVGNVGTPAVASFTFDAAGPSAAISAPAAGSTATASGWIGLVGTAADAGAGVQLVEYRVLTAGGPVWDGGSFAAGGWFAAAGTTSWTAAFPFTNFPVGGGYRVEARATDAVGNVGLVAAVDFSVAVPSVTGIARQSPAAAVMNTTAPVTWRVTFSDPVSGVTAANFALVGSFATGTAIVDVAPAGGSDWDVTATVPAAGTGTLGLNYVSNVNLTPAAATALVVGAVFTLDRVAPTVAITNDAPAAVIRVNQPVRYTVTFADDTAVGSATLTAADVTNAAGAGAGAGAGAAPFTVGGFTSTGPSSYAFDVTMTGEGDFRLRLAAPAVADTAGNTLAVPVIDTATLTADGTAPTVASVVPVGTSPTTAATVRYIVTFSEPVSGVDPADFDLTTSGAIAPGAITVSPGSGTTFTVDVDTGSGDGTIRLDVLANGTIRDAAGNPLAAAFTTAAAFTIDRTVPTVAVTLDAGQATLAVAQPVRFSVTFSEPVADFGPSDVVLGGSAGGFVTATKQVTNPNGDGRTFLVEVSGLTADGTVTVTVSPGAASDGAGNVLAVGATSPTVTLDQTAPFVTAMSRVEPSPTNDASVRYTVTFSEAVGDVDAGDFALVTTGLSGASITSVGGGGAVWTVAVNTGSGDGTLRLDLRTDATTTDAAGNPLPAGGFTGEVFDIDRTGPTALIAAPTPALRNTPVGSVAVTFDQAGGGLDVADFTLTRDGVALDLADAELTGGDTAYALGNLAGLTAAGGVYVLTLTAAGSGVADAAGNPITGNAATTFTVDVAAPTVTITPAVTGPTNAATVAFTVAFSEPVGSVDTDPTGGFDFFAVTGTAPGAAVLAVVPGAAGVYTVTVDAGNGDGTVGLTFGANTVVTDAAGNAVSGLPVASGFTAVDHVRPTVVITDADSDGVVAVNATVTFTVVVLDGSGVGGALTAADFENAGTAGLSVGTVTRTAVAGGLQFGVPVTPTSGGTVLLRLKAGAAIADAAGNDPDLPVVAGRTLVVDADAPTVTVSRADGQGAVTNTQPVLFTVVFSKPVVGFDRGVVRLAGPGTSGAGITVIGDGQTFVVTVSGLTADGAVTLSVLAAAVADAAGNPNAASAGGDNTVTLDTAPPAAGTPVLAPASDTGAADGVTSDATPTFTGTAEPGATVELFEGATLLGTATATAAGWTIASAALADGPHVLVARATDAAGNTSDSGLVSVLIDTARPAVSVTRAPGQPDTVLSDAAGISVTFAVTTSEPVGSLNPAAVSVVGTAGGSFTGVTGSGTSFLVTVGGITRAGSVSVTVAEGAAADAAGNPTLAAPTGESIEVRFPVLPPLPTGQNSTDVYATVAGTAVTLFNGDGSVRGTVSPFTRDESPFEVRVAVADVTGDGVPDVVAGTAAGAPAAVRVLDGATGKTVYSLGVFEGFRGGVFVAAGDLNGDGKAEFVVTPDQNGGPRVLVFDGATGGQLASFLGIQDENFRGGARVAVGDLNADGVADLLVSAGFGGGPRVAGFDGTSVASGKEPKKLFADFFLFAPDLRDGAYVTVGDVDGDGYGDVIGGAGPGGAPHVLALSGYDLVTTGTLTPVASFFAGPIESRGGVRVAAKDFDGDSRAELVTGSGDTTAVFVYGNGALNVADPRPDIGLELLPGLLPGVHVG